MMEYVHKEYPNLSDDEKDQQPNNEQDEFNKTREDLFDRNVIRLMQQRID